jgi:hypothetical protein
MSSQQVRAAPGNRARRAPKDAKGAVRAVSGPARRLSAVAARYERSRLRRTYCMMPPLR